MNKRSNIGVHVETLTKFIIPGIIFLLTLVFGIWLSNSSKPYNGILFNIHKLIALVAVIVTTMQIYMILKGMEISRHYIGYLCSIMRSRFICHWRFYEPGKIKS
jgi:ribose/xylose/arabinose/galactoside ABC-type transport system permease subunit